MTLEEIKRLIANNEGRHLELKKTTAELQSGMRTTFLENWGTGVRRIIDICARYNVPEPVWSIDGGFVCVTFKRPKYDPSTIQVRSKYDPSTIQVLTK